MKRLAFLAQLFVACAATFCTHAFAANGSPNGSQTSAEFSLQGSGGSLLSIKSVEGKVSVSVSPRQPRLGDQEVSEYAVNGSTSRDAIRADFRAFGEISVQFVPSGKVRERNLKLPPHCDGPKKIVRREGTFVGTIKFTGENDYTSVVATEAAGSVGTPLEFFCVKGGPVTSPGSHQRIPTVLSAGMSSGRLGFEAALLRRGRVEFSAGETSEVEGVSILRLVTKSDRSSRFRFDRDYRTATVAPPAPFSGAATFKRGSRGSKSTWSGSLSVSFPGKSDVPLTGTPFTRLSLARF
jgi:hypothetical protein